MLHLKRIGIFAFTAALSFGSVQALAGPEDRVTGTDRSTQPAETAAFNPCLCDLNGDKAVGLADIGIFAADYHGGGHPKRSDFNRDGVVNLIDVVMMTMALGTTGCP